MCGATYERWMARYGAAEEKLDAQLVMAAARLMKRLWPRDLGLPSLAGAAWANYDCDLGYRKPRDFKIDRNSYSDLFTEVCAMNSCIVCWSRYMRAMTLARRHPDPSVRRALIQDAFEWLDRYFDAEDIELARREHMPVRR